MYICQDLAIRLVLGLGDGACGGEKGGIGRRGGGEGWVGDMNWSYGMGG